MLPERAYALINLDNIQKNVKKAMDRVAPSRVMAIVKANAYGHGAVEVCRALSEIGITDFGVAAVSEAVELRKNGILGRILVLGKTFRSEFYDVVQYGIDTALFELDDGLALSEAAHKLGKKAGVYIKIDTGMGRIGFQPCEADAGKIKQLFMLENLDMLGAFTHFAKADFADKAFAEEQRKRFIDFTDLLISQGCPLPVRHMYNSAAIMEMKGFAGDMVRSGIITYGLYPSEEMSRDYELFPAMELKSHVAFVKNVGKGFTVSYGSTFVTDRETKIATVPVGYADGYPRYLSNKGEVLISGTRCRILGRVCMDQFMVDVTHLPNVKVGDTVTLIGTDGSETVTMEEVSDSEYRFNYELPCLITQRVPRVYIKNGKVI